jgi:hypothetical protein
MSDVCDKCPDRATVGVVGLKNGEVYHHSYCDKHFNKMKMDSKVRGSKPSRVVTEDELALRELGFRMKSINKGKQLVLTKKFVKIDFWPASGKFLIRNTNESGVGIGLLADRVDSLL